MSVEALFFFKDHAENELKRLVPDLFCFFKKLHIRSKQVVSTLVLIYFGSPRLWHTIKTGCITFYTIDPESYSILLFIKRSETSFPSTSYAWFFKKYFLYYVLLTDQISLSDCLYFLIYRQYVSCYYFLSSLWRHKFWKL